MPKYKVELARVTWLTATVEADSPDQALEKAHELTPPFSARESGHGSPGWTAGADEWLPINEFYDTYGKYNEAAHGPVVELADDE